MDKAELARYFDGQKSIVIMNSETFIDYDSIENPIKSIQRGYTEFFPHSSYVEHTKIYLKINKFSDTS